MNGGDCGNRVMFLVVHCEGGGGGGGGGGRDGG